MEIQHGYYTTWYLVFKQNSSKHKKNIPPPIHFCWESLQIHPSCHVRPGRSKCFCIFRMAVAEMSMLVICWYPAAWSSAEKAEFPQPTTRRSPEPSRLTGQNSSKVSLVLLPAFWSQPGRRKKQKGWRWNVASQGCLKAGGNLEKIMPA